jgi:hypothetical protein
MFPATRAAGNLDTRGMTENLPVTRRSLHGVAELILAGQSYRSAGRIRLAVLPDGFATVAMPDEPARLVVQGTEIVVEAADGDRRHVPMEGTFGELAAAVGVECGAPVGLYDDTTGLGPDDYVAVDPHDTATLFAWFAAGDTALRRFADAHADGGTRPILWPEHFDVAITVDEVNYGVSGGDTAHPQPYAYIGPWTPREGDFWNVSFGALRGLDELGADADAILQFFEAGRSALG